MPQPRGARAFAQACLWTVLTLLVACGGPPTGANAPLSGRVIDGSGHPAAGVLVRAQFTNAIPFTNSIPLTVSSVQASEAKTGSDGRFSFTTPPQGDVTVEAVASDDQKALKQGVPVRAGVATDVGDLKLAPTGTIAGQVMVPGQAGLNLLGTDVFLPGVSYLAKTDEGGSYRLVNVPAGTYRVVATNASLGRAEAVGVVLGPGEVKNLDPLALAVDAPQIDALQPDHGGAGSLFDIVGAHFGASTTGGLSVEVYVNGVRASDVSVVSDTLVRARIPAGAQSGPVVVRVGLIAGTSQMSFRVLRDLALDPPGPLLLPLNGVLRVTARGTDTTGASVPAPSVAWTSDATGVVTVDPATPGQVRGVQLGATLLHATSGTLEALARVFVAPLVGDPWRHGQPATPSASVAVGNNGAIAVWAAAGSGGYRLVGQRLTGSPWSAADLGFTGAFSLDPQPAVAWDAPASRYWLAYADGSDAARGVRAQALDSSGVPAGDPTSVAAGRLGVSEVGLVARGNDALVVWREPGGAIACRTVGGSSAPAVIATSNAAYPSVAWDGTSYWVTWDQVVGGTGRVMARAVDVNGQVAAVTVELGSHALPLAPPALAAAPGQLFSAWSDVKQGTRSLWGRRMVGGSAVGAAIDLGVQQPGHGPQTSPVLAWNGHRYVLAWQDGRPDAPGLFAQTFDPDLQAPGPPFACALAPNQALLALGAYGPDGYLLWGNSQGEVWGQRIAP